jgi:hypothetical protein
LLIAGESSTDTFDGTTFHDTTRTIGSSGTIDNSNTSDIADPQAPTTVELMAALEVAIQQMARFADDKGRIGFNGTAMNNLRCVIPPEQRRAFSEVTNSTIIISGSGTAGVSNPWGNGLVGFDELPWLTDADNAFYLHALGAVKKPFYFQEREPLEVIVLNGADDVALWNGVKVLVRERFRFAYGDPRRGFRHDFT